MSHPGSILSLRRIGRQFIHEFTWCDQAGLWTSCFVFYLARLGRVESTSYR